jgi:hypothetical protein
MGLERVGRLACQAVLGVTRTKQQQSAARSSFAHQPGHHRNLSARAAGGRFGSSFRIYTLVLSCTGAI